MKKAIICLIVLAVLLAVSSRPNAELILRGEGTSDYGAYRLIYDTDFDITWYDYTRTADTWQNQMNWANELSVTFGSNIYTDWRLPSALNQDGTGYCGAYNCTGSELGHLFYTELGNKSYYDTNGYPRPDRGLRNTGDFQSLQPQWYWSGTYNSIYTAAWMFEMNMGYQDLIQTNPTSTSAFISYSIAVRDGDVATVVPEPISSTLFIIGTGLLAGRRYWRRKK